MSTHNSQSKNTADALEKPIVGTHTPADNRVKIIEAEHIKELRERLYARGTQQSHIIRHELPRHEIHERIEKPEGSTFQTVSSGEKHTEKKIASHEHTTENIVYPHAQTLPVDAVVKDENAVSYTVPMATSSRRKMYRKKVALVGGIFFICALAFASFFMFWGNNTISGENISIDTSGPIAIGGGEEFAFQVSIANQNTVPIQSATLIIQYPKGTQSAEGADKEISVERTQIESIGTGELINIPLKARIFGEENEEKEIKVSIDYRIEGSNATFHKESAPLKFKVSTAPLVMVFDSVTSVSSGQEVELKLTVQSNSPTPLSDILIKTSYPDGFDFTKATPDTLSGEDTWRIVTLKPAEKKIITIRGLMTGYADETRTFIATAGVANETDKNTLASVLAKTQTKISIEQPFLDVGVSINDSTAESVIVNINSSANIEISFKNTLDSALYDGKVLVELSGNALNEFEVGESGGFYDSTLNTITWDSVDEVSLKEILPGQTNRLRFVLNPKSDIGTTPEIKMKVTVRGQRVFENRVPEELVGTASRTVKVESIPTLKSSALYSSGPFTNTGPTPPVAEKVTQYTYTLKVRTGTNAVTGGEVIAVLPQYMSWLDLVTSDDDVSYSASTRTMRWSIGDMDANSEKEVSVQVSFLPSLSQVNTTPTILETQRFKATDRFTGTVVRAEHPALTTSLFDESDTNFKDGKVRAE